MNKNEKQVFELEKSFAMIVEGERKHWAAGERFVAGVDDETIGLLQRYDAEIKPIKDKDKDKDKENESMQNTSRLYDVIFISNDRQEHCVSAGNGIDAIRAVLGIATPCAAFTIICKPRESVK